jgi:hypothetical protein
MPTKRNIKNGVEDLKEETDDDSSEPVVFAITYFEHEGKRWPDMEDSPHPELTIKPFPERKPKSLKLATPNVIPEPWCNERTLFITTCENADKYLLDPDTDDNGNVPACELWDALSEEQLREDKAIRKEEGDQIPPRLKDL